MLWLITLREMVRELFKAGKESGDEYLVTPGPRSGIERRSFHDLQDEEIKARADEVLIK